MRCMLSAAQCLALDFRINVRMRLPVFTSCCILQTAPGPLGDRLLPDTAEDSVFVSGIQCQLCLHCVVRGFLSLFVRERNTPNWGSGHSLSCFDPVLVFRDLASIRGAFVIRAHLPESIPSVLKIQRFCSHGQNGGSHLQSGAQAVC